MSLRSPFPIPLDRARPSGLVREQGDLNAAPWNRHFRRLVKRSGLIDSSKGRGIQPTWPSNNLLLLIPLDHFLHSPEIAVLDKKVGANVGSGLLSNLHAT